MRRAFAGLGLTCLIASISVWQREYNFFLVSTRQPLDWVLAPSKVELKPPFSVEGHYITLQSCDRTMASISVRLASQNDRARIAQSCADLSDGILNESPSLSLAYLVRAQARLTLEETASGFGDLLASEQTGGAISWMATRRFDLAMARFGEAEQKSKDMMARDLATVMMSGRSGIGRVARLYVGSDYEILRQFVVETVNTLSNETQRRFIAVVRKVS